MEVNIRPRLSHSNSFGNDAEKDTAGCRAFNRKYIVIGVENMAVFRVERNKGYTVMSNHHLRNKDLSLKAKGLLSQMLSLPEDWDYTLKGLRRTSA